MVEEESESGVVHAHGVAYDGIKRSAKTIGYNYDGKVEGGEDGLSCKLVLTDSVNEDAHNLDSPGLNYNESHA